MNDYYPFGLAMPGRSSNSANPNDNYKYIGEEFDDEVGLSIYNLNARTYDPVTARFMQIDPLFDHPAQIGLSPYNYSWNNPVNLSDPTGECPIYWAVAGAIWVGTEIGLAAYDIYDVVTTLSDENATTTQKIVSVGGATAGLLLPGGGYSAADDIVEVAATHGDDIIESADAFTTKEVTNSAGQTETRSFVKNQDDLLQVAENFAGGLLDNFTEIKPGWFEGTVDGKKLKIEWQPGGEPVMGEGPHVKIMQWDPDKGKKGGWRTTDKFFIEE